MRALITKIANWFAALSNREKILVIMAGLLAAATLGVYAITLPLLNAIDGKRGDYFAALERRANIEAQVDAAIKNPAAPAVLPAGTVQQIVTQSAIESGFLLDKAEARGDDLVEIAMAKAKPAAFMVWLGEWEERGLITRNLSIRAGNDGTAAITATLARQPE